MQGTETTNPGGTEIGSPKGVFGILVDATGSPRAGAKVRVVPFGKSPLLKPSAGAASDSVITNGNGFFQIVGLPKGSYNVLGDFGEGALVVRIPVMDYAGDSASLGLGVDTLRLPGQIKGSILVQGKGKGGILCYLPGTSYLSISNEEGAYWITGIPQGTYNLSFGYPGFQTATDSGIVVLAGQATLQGARSLGYDTAYPPPPPSSVRVAYDSAHGVATVSWSRPDVPDLDGYVVYRVNPATSEAERVNAALVRDTVFRENLFTDPLDTGSREVTYRVKSQDSSANLSQVFSEAVSLNAPGPGSTRTSISIRIEGPYGSDVPIGDSVRILAAYASRRLTHTRAAWYENGSGLPLRDRQAALPASGVDTLVRAWKDSGMVRLVFETIDASGILWKDSIGIDVLQGRPTASAGRQLAVPAGKPARLTGRGTDKYGTIVQYAWDFEGDGVFDDSSTTTGDVSHTFAAGPHRAVFRVIDDDGNRAYDTLAFVAGGAPVLDTLGQDMLLTKDAGPYQIDGQLTVKAGVVVTIEPGTELRFGAQGRIRVFGTLIAVGTPGDSIVFTSPGVGPASDYSEDRAGGIQFEKGSGSIAHDSEYVSGSRIRFAAFRGTAGIFMHSAYVAVEDCGFTDVWAAAPLNGETPGVVGVYGNESQAGSWICSRNRFRGCQGPAIGYLAQNDDPHVRVDVHVKDNDIHGEGITIMLSYLDSGLTVIESNTIVVDAHPTDHTATGLFLGGGNPEAGNRFIVEDNLIQDAETGLFIQNYTHMDMSHNEIRNCTHAIFDQGIMGRFHDNIVTAGDITLNVGQMSFAADSNDFGPTVSIACPAYPFDFRNNYWGTSDASSIKMRIQASEGYLPDPQQPLYTPFLEAAPPGAGRIAR